MTHMAFLFSILKLLELGRWRRDKVRGKKREKTKGFISCPGLQLFNMLTVPILLCPCLPNTPALFFCPPDRHECRPGDKTDCLSISAGPKHLTVGAVIQHQTFTNQRGRRSQSSQAITRIQSDKQTEESVCEKELWRAQVVGRVPFGVQLRSSEES